MIVTDSIRRKTGIKQPNIIGRNIARTRAFWEMTQQELADGIAVNVQYIARVEQGRTQLKAEHLPPIARLLRCLPEELTDRHLTED
jgi:transcriptional regulator with XRE-family HTH domain